MNHSNRSFMFLASILPLSLFAQLTVSGTVTDASTGAALPGANVVVEGTDLGAAAGSNGSYSIAGVPAGATITASMIGYTSASATAASTLNFKLQASAIQLSALEVMASRADEKTPVAFTNVNKADMDLRLGSQDIPMSLNATPSVYATLQGGGAGDARVNVRGFNQRNVAVMINGVPQNDMENGWVYWSNWDGVGDATSSIQMQRGLSAVNLATPSIGGTMNIITDPTAHNRGGKFKQEIGEGGFLKSTLNYNTGLIGDKYAFSATLVRKTGDGIIDKTWTDAWAYYFGASYQMNETNRFELYAIGAPQRHGQNSYKQNAVMYDSAFAKDELEYSREALDWKSQSSDGRNYNENWNVITSSTTTKEYWYMYGEGGLFGEWRGTVDRHAKGYLNERENYFHKPLVNLNHFLTINDKMRLSSILYWSGGSGGGTGTMGSIKWDYASQPTRIADWDQTIATNAANLDTLYSTTKYRSKGILRNSINRQNTFGFISKLNYDLSDAINFQAGLDWRTARIEHAREVRNLLGGDYYVDTKNANETTNAAKMNYLGDIVDYWNETTVDWIGFFGQGSYNAGPLSAYGMFGLSFIAYSYQNHFTVEDEVVTADPISSKQFKGGAMYDVMDGLSVFGNFGVVEKAPIMDNVINVEGYVATDPANEKFVSFEAGANYSVSNIAVKANFYSTDWQDRNLTKAVETGQGSSGDTDIIYLKGVNQKHTGIEVEASYQALPMLRLDAALGLGTWKFVSDADGTYQELTDSGYVMTEYAYALDGLYVGDMPQTSYTFGFTLTPLAGLKAQVLYNMYDKHYADWDPASREIKSGTEADRDQVWQAPGYSKMDMHLTYDLPVNVAGLKLQAFAHVFNVLDAVFVQDAYDNSPYNGFNDDGKHDATSAEVFLGTPRYFNAGLTVNF